MGTVPAGKLRLAQAHLEALLPGGDYLLGLGETLKTVSMDAVYAPGFLAWFHAQATLLSVDRKYGKL